LPGENIIYYQMLNADNNIEFRQYNLPSFSPFALVIFFMY